MGHKKTRPNGPRKKAKDFLNTFLDSGPRPQKETESQAIKELISIRTLRHAKKELGVVSKKDGLAGGWFWHLPEKEGDHAA
jgi:putative DNA primase/helicase